LRANGIGRDGQRFRPQLFRVQFDFLSIAENAWETGLTVSEWPSNRNPPGFNA
jgi:hypothetical protein